MRGAREYSIVLPYADICGIHFSGKRVMRLIDGARSATFRVGDVINVKEPYYLLWDGSGIVYRVGSEESECLGLEYVRAVFMPVERVRYRLLVVEARLEHLRDIEGYRGWEEEGFGGLLEYKVFWNDKVGYKRVKEYGWLANPCVQVIKFDVM